jgi:hypothetical protein
MTPRQELLTEQRIGPEGAALLYRLVYIVARARNFPPPSGYESWDESAVTETAHDFLVGERGRRRVIEIAIRSVDDESFERIMEAAVVNHLREVSRRTDTGRLILRVSEILHDEDTFMRVEGPPARWTLTGGNEAPSITPDTALATAVAGTPVSVPRWNSERRSAPLADRGSLVLLLGAILTAADGSLTARNIAQVVATRIDHRRVPLSIELDAPEAAAEQSERTDPAVQVENMLRAKQIFNELDDRDRIMVARYEEPVRDLGDVLALRRSQAALLRQRLTARLRHEFEDDADPEGTIAELRRLCEAWIEDRTAALGATFNSSEDTVAGTARKGDR